MAWGKIWHIAALAGLFALMGIGLAVAQPPVEIVGAAQPVCATRRPDLCLVIDMKRHSETSLRQELGENLPHGFAKAMAIAAVDDEHGAGAYVIGAEDAAHAGPYLAFAPQGSLDQPEAWAFFTGRGLAGSVNWVDFRRWQSPATAAGDWTPGARAALFAPEQKAKACGAYQLDWNVGLQRWLLFYGCDGSGFVRVARNVPGPWSAPTLLFQGAGLDVADGISWAGYAGSPKDSGVALAGARQSLVCWSAFGGIAPHAWLACSTLRQNGDE